MVRLHREIDVLVLEKDKRVLGFLNLSQPPNVIRPWMEGHQTMDGYQVSQFRMTPPNWYVTFSDVLDGSGLPKIAAGPFKSQNAAEQWVGHEIEWQRSPENPSFWD